MDHAAPSQFVDNAHVNEALVEAHASYIWGLVKVDEKNSGRVVGYLANGQPQSMSAMSYAHAQEVLGLLEEAQKAMDNGAAYPSSLARNLSNADAAAYFVERAAAKVFGDGSVEYAQLAGFYALGSFSVVRKGPDGAVGYF